MLAYLVIGLMLISGESQAQSLRDIIERYNLTPGDTLPGVLEIVIKESSYPSFDREAVVNGNLRTGLASIDSLNQQEGLIEIRPSFASPTDPNLYPRLAYTFVFPPEKDLVRLVQVYQQNEHIRAAEILIVGLALDETLIQSERWGQVKEVIYNSQGNRSKN